MAEIAAFWAMALISGLMLGGFGASTGTGSGRLLTLYLSSAYTGLISSMNTSSDPDLTEESLCLLLSSVSDSDLLEFLDVLGDLPEE